MNDPVHYETLAGYYTTAATRTRHLSRVLVQERQADVDLGIIRRKYDEAQKVLDAATPVDMSLTDKGVVYTQLGKASLELQHAITAKAYVSTMVRTARQDLAKIQSLIKDWYAGEEVAQQFPGFSQ